MSETEVPVYCYWNGCIKYGTEGVYYEGSTPRRIIVNPKIALNRLLDEMYVLAGVDIDKERSKVKVFGRYPSVVGGESTFQYLLMPVVNSQSLETMLEVPSKHPCIKNVELYLEVIDHPGRSSKRQRTTGIAVKVEMDCSNGLSEEAAEVINLTGEKDSDSGGPDTCLSGLWLEDHDMRVGLCFRDVDELKKAVDWCSIKGLHKSVVRETGTTELSEWWRTKTGYGLETKDARAAKEEAVKRVFGGDWDQSFEDLPKLSWPEESLVASGLEKVTPQSQWALAHDGGRRYGIMELDTAALFSVCRGFELADHVLTGSLLLLFDELRVCFNERSLFSRFSLNCGDVYTKPVADKLEEFRKASVAYVVMPLENNAFQVAAASSGNDKWIVQLSDYCTCTCGDFQKFKFPCLHALAVCKKLKINPLQYVDDCYTCERYYKTYSAAFSPVPKLSAWQEDSGVPRLFPPVIPPPPPPPPPTPYVAYKAQRKTTPKTAEPCTCTCGKFPCLYALAVYENLINNPLQYLATLSVWPENSGVPTFFLPVIPPPNHVSGKSRRFIQNVTFIC
ncbi:hypothetical protein IGI04_021379 [Brassica rapa subsp. trilocularis]|uniref:SWIM-type domain-containing protein n=1 Tax=Brassica rapa subsp. trilocularis TaxID=1813537 RepID=A0ABQ7M216_BRACM|nr:hypothetical protein IGI04_021379 [Brassica rapa subsp. trilocularis]